MECPVKNPVSPRPLALRSAVVGVLAATVVGIAVGASGLVISVPSAQAADTSAVTITAAAMDLDYANAPMPALAVIVSQTRDLVSQGLEISWTGGMKSTLPGTDTGGENFLQIMQCWGDDPSVPAGQPAQPDRTTCQYGGLNAAGARRDSTGQLANVAAADQQYTAPGFGTDVYTSIPFRSVSGKTIASVVNNMQVPVDVNTNEFFTAYTTNEIKWAGSSAAGVGSAKFEVQTAQQADGLGCGSPVAAANGTITGQSCWLVVIPRGEADQGEQHINQSGLLWNSWKHRLAVKLDFKPLGINCALGAAEQQLAGSELIAGAVASWQPVLCNAAGGSIYTLSTGTESDAVVASSGTAPSALAFTSRPLATPGAADPNAYAPVALTGLSISFAIDRQPRAGSSTPAEYAAKANESFTTLNLTPRLVAKLLTSSYLDSLPTGADKSHLGQNARNLTSDPDFLAINDPEWAYQALTSPSLADLLSPQGRSDSAWQLWRYVTADADAATFLAGTPDQWGMIVNPWSSTSATVNPSGSALELPTDSFPKADPAEEAAIEGLSGPINVVTWRPYTNDLDQSAYYTLRGDGQVLGAWDAVNSVPPKYLKAARSVPGFQKVLGLTDVASAEKYQIVSASLRNPAGAFVAPTVDSMTAAAAAMTKTAAQSQVYEYDPAGANAKAAPSAYPLTMPVYATINPLQTDSTILTSYAAFIQFAVQSGQTPGTASGQLPAGYAPLPAGWRTQALAAAASISGGVPQTSSTDSSYNYSPAFADAGLVDPIATGSTADLFGPSTPDDPDTGVMPVAIPASLLAGLAAAAAVPLMSRIRRP
jgi:hypothetical protein